MGNNLLNVPYLFYNQEEQTFIEGIVVEIDGVLYYYTYQKMADGYYEMQEVTKTIFDFLFRSTYFKHKEKYKHINRSDLHEAYFEEKNSHFSLK